MNDKPTKITVDCLTGSVEVIEMTTEEIEACKNASFFEAIAKEHE